MSELIRYLKSKMHEKSMSAYEIHRRSIDKISYPYIKQILRGETKSPSPEILKHIARAINEPYADILIAAGHIDKKDAEEINEIFGNLLEPFFEKKIKRVLMHDKMREILEYLIKVPEDKRDMVYDFFITYLKGLVNE